MNYKEILFFKKCSEQVSPQEEEYVQEYLSSSEKFFYNLLNSLK